MRAEVDADTVDDAVLRQFGARVFALNPWLHFSRAVERRSPDAYFVYFFGDLVRRPLRTLDDMLVFVGAFPDVLVQSDVAAVAEATRFECALRGSVGHAAKWKCVTLRARITS